MAIKERWKGFAELPADIEQRLEQLPALLRAHGVLLAYLFGSLTRDDLACDGAPGDAANDVDLAVWSPDEPAYRLREPLVQCLGTERLDLVDLQRASPVLRFEILRTSRPLYVVDEAFQQRYEMQTLRVYRDTHFLRRRQREYLRERFAKWSSDQRPSSFGFKS
jgi:predicted nucleotidyltransferase